MPSTTISSIEADLIRDEGTRDKVYKDSRGFNTIGVGHNLDAEGLCQEAIYAQLQYDVKQKEKDLDAHLAWWREHPEPVQRVLLNLCFNLGIHSLLTFKATLLAIRVKQYSIAATHLLDSLYAKQVGQRAVRLANLLRSIV